MSDFEEYLQGLEKMQIKLDELPDIDEQTFEFYEKLTDLIDDEYDRVYSLLIKENNKHIPRID